MQDRPIPGVVVGGGVTSDSGATRWMTYAELAAFLGVEEESARRRAMRRRWPRRAGNDGRTRVAVPAEVQPGKPSAEETDDAEEEAGASDLLEELRASLERERARADAAERDREAARVQAAAAMGELHAIREHLARERERAELAEHDREAAKVEAAAAEGAARVLREELTRERERAEAARAQAAAAEAEGQGLREELGQAQAWAADAEEAIRLWREGGALARAWRAFFHR